MFLLSLQFLTLSTLHHIIGKSTFPTSPRSQNSTADLWAMKHEMTLKTLLNMLTSSANTQGKGSSTKHSLGFQRASLVKWAQLDMFKILKSALHLDSRIVSNCEKLRKQVLMLALKCCLNSEFICQIPTAFSFIPFCFWSLEKPHQYQMSLSLIQTEESRHRGYTRDLADLGPQ